jgi:hypothetical protein
VERVVYCTARITDDGTMRWRDQDVCLRALRAAEAVHHIEFGTYVNRIVHGVGRHWWYRLTRDDLTTASSRPSSAKSGDRTAGDRLCRL